MTRQYLSGVLWVAVALGPVLFGAVRVRARVLPGWGGAAARLAETVFVLGVVMLVSELLGTFGAFRRWPVVAACAAVGLVAAMIAGRSVGAAGDVDHFPEEAGSERQIATAVAMLVAAFVIALWAVGMFAAFSGGPVDVDTQTYHLPHAARFVQEGRLTELHFATVDDGTPYHPLNAELVHALGILAFRTDVLTPIANMGWLLLAFAAGWVFGERWRRGPYALVAVCVAFATPIMATTQGGSAMSDVAAVALLLVSVALLVHARGLDPPIAFAGLAGGLALGSKLTMVVPIAVLSVAALFVSRREGYAPLRFARLWGIPVFLGGSFWYLRNLARVGTPVPSLRLGIGPIAFPKIPMKLVDNYGYAVADYAFDSGVWRRYFLPGLERGLGRGWPILIVLALAGLVLAIWSGRTPFTRAAALSFLAFAVVYPFTPTTALGLKGRPTLFTANLRYVVPVLVFGLLVGSTLTFLEARLRRWSFVTLCVLPLVLLARTEWQGRAVEAVACGSVLALLIPVARVVRTRSRSMVVAIVVAATTVAVAVGNAWYGRYLEERYAFRSPTTTSGRDVAAFAWAQDVSDAKIGIAGFFVNYPLFGARLTNDVSYVGDLRENHEFTNYVSCADWRSAVNDGHYDYIVTMPPFAGYPEPAAAGWTRTDDAVTAIRNGEKTTVFRIDGRLDPSGCPSTDDAPGRRSAGALRDAL